MARYIDLSDKAKAAVQLRDARHTDWDADLSRIADEAEAVKYMPLTSERRRVRMLEALRREYAATLRMRRFALTGVNSMHVGLSA